MLVIGGNRRIDRGSALAFPPLRFRGINEFQPVIFLIHGDRRLVHFCVAIKFLWGKGKKKADQLVSRDVDLSVRLLGNLPAWFPCVFPQRAKTKKKKSPGRECTFSRAVLLPGRVLRLFSVLSTPLSAGPIRSLHPFRSRGGKKSESPPRAKTCFPVSVSFVSSAVGCVQGWICREDKRVVSRFYCV